MEVSLYVSSLPDDATAANLAEQFEPFGRLTQKVVLRKKAGLLFGFVNLWVESEEEVEKCIAALHNSLWRGQRMRVERAKTNPDAERQKTFLKKFEENVAAKAEVKERKVAETPVERPKRDVQEREEDKRAAKKKKKLEKKKLREEERKIRVRPVADVAKATPWDAVLGHTWEERKEGNASGFSLLSVVGKQDEEVEERHLESAATRAFARQVNKEKREEEEGKLDSNPRLASFVSKIEQSGAKPDPPKPNGSLVLNFGGDSFMRDEQEIDKVLEMWHQERTELRKDFKSKKRKSEKSSKTTVRRL